MSPKHNPKLPTLSPLIRAVLNGQEPNAEDWEAADLRGKLGSEALQHILDDALNTPGDPSNWQELVRRFSGLKEIPTRSVAIGNFVYGWNWRGDPEFAFQFDLIASDAGRLLARIASKEDIAVAEQCCTEECFVHNVGPFEHLIPLGPVGEMLIPACDVDAAYSSVSPHPGDRKENRIYANLWKFCVRLYLNHLKAYGVLRDPAKGSIELCLQLQFNDANHLLREESGEAAVRRNAAYQKIAEEWSRVKRSEIDIKLLEDLARKFERLQAEIAALKPEDRKLVAERLHFFTDFDDVHTSRISESVQGVKLENLAADAGQLVGKKAGIERSGRRAWAAFWEWCVWFHCEATGDKNVFHGGEKQEGGRMNNPIVQSLHCIETLKLTAKDATPMQSSEAELSKASDAPEERAQTKVSEAVAGNETQERRGRRRTAALAPHMKRIGKSTPEALAGSAVDKNTVRDYLNGKTVKLRDTTREALATAFDVERTDLPD